MGATSLGTISETDWCTLRKVNGHSTKPGVCLSASKGASVWTSLLYLLRCGSSSLLVTAVYIHIRCCIPNGVHNFFFLHGDRISFFFSLLCFSFFSMFRFSHPLGAFLLHHGNGVQGSSGSIFYSLARLDKQASHDDCVCCSILFLSLYVLFFAFLLFCKCIRIHKYIQHIARKK